MPEYTGCTEVNWENPIKTMQRNSQTCFTEFLYDKKLDPSTSLNALDVNLTEKNLSIDLLYVGDEEARK